MANNLKRIDKFEYISFDIYDTLVNRYTVCPTDVFMLVEDRFNLNHVNAVNDFVSKRLEAERTARNKAYPKEVKISDIYEELKGIDIQDKSELLCIELEIEKNICYPRKQGIELFKYCIDKGKKVFLISDMYLPREVITQVLVNCGIEGYDELFISAECNLTKANGALYKYVCELKKIDPQCLLHFGDNILSDYFRAKQKGIRAVHLKSESKKYTGNVYTDILNSFLSIKFSNNQFKDFGYSVFGPLLYGLCRWIKYNLDTNNEEKVFFLSRDGYIVKRAFDLLYENDTNYLYVSRRSLRVPMLENVGYNEACDLLPLGSQIAYGTIFDSWGLEHLDSHELEALGCTYDATTNRNKLHEDKALQQIFNRYRNQIAFVAQKERESLMGYLEQEKVNGRIAIIDIGWNGSMQNALSRVLPSADIYGYYVGVADGAKVLSNNVKSKMRGYVFNCLQGDKDIKNPFVGMIEMLFLSQEGSTYKYEYNVSEKKYKPLLYNYECDPDDEKKICDIQTGALEFCEQFNVLLNSLSIVFPDECLYRRIVSVGLKPSLKDAKLLGEMSFYDGKVFKLASPRSLLYYLFHLRKFKSDFIESRWKTAFLKRLFKLPLNYENIYYWLKKGRA